MVTYNCKGCSFSVSHLQMTARVTPDGGLRELRAWADHRLVPLQGSPNRHWMQGRNQALFSAAASPPLEITAAASAAASTPPLGLMVQPWLGLIGSLGAPRFTQHHINCSHRRHASACAHLTSGVHRLVAVTRGPSRKQRHLMARDPGNRGGGGDGARWRRNARTAGTIVGAQAHAPFWGDAALKHNHSAQVAAFDRGGPRLSTTANLLRVRRLTATASHAATPAAATATASAEHGRCEAYLGIGHVHRGEGRLNRQDRENRKTWRQQRGGGAPRSRGGANATTFMFGYDYTHFFYTLSPVPPYQLLSTSAEFCAGSMQDGNDCESVQFISGLAFGASNLSDAAAGNTGGTGDGPGAGDAGDIARDGAGDIVLSFGVNDCESRLGRIGLARVWSMLVPLPCATPPCAACAQV